MATKKAAKKAAKKKVAKKPAKKAAKKPAKKKVAAKKPAKKVVKKKAAKKPAAKKAKVKRAPNPAFMRPMNISPDLAKIVGSKPIPRTEVAKKVWEYIRKNGLQDKVNKRMINADDNLKTVFGGRDQVSMFDMTKLINRHLS